MKQLLLLCALGLSACSGSIGPLIGDESEPNDTVAQADNLGNVPPTASIQGVIEEASGEFDVFRVGVDLPALPQVGSLSVSVEQENPATDLVVLVVNSSSMSLATIDSGSAGASESGLVALDTGDVPDGNVYVSIFCIGPDSEYTLDVTLVTSIPVQEPPAGPGVGLPMAEAAARIRAAKAEPGAVRVLRERVRIELLEGRAER